MTAFVPGLELGRLLYEEAVRPFLQDRFPRVEHAAALVGKGSEVLGFDDTTSTDHDWGPRVMLFLSEDDRARHGDAIREGLRQALPTEIRGWPTNFSSADESADGVQQLRPIESGPVNHRVELLALGPWLEGHLGLDPRGGLTPTDWLLIPGQKLRSLVQGAVYHDGPGELTRVRELLARYPEDVWLFLMAAGWQRVAQEEHLVGRAALRGDELGSRLLAARLVHELMHLAFLMRQEYPPYAKWFGTAFARLPDLGELPAQLAAVLDAATWTDRETHLVRAWETVAEMHGALGVTDSLATECSQFHGRPLTVPKAQRFVDALVDRLGDDELRRLGSEGPLGSVDQLTTSADLLESSRACLRLRVLHAGPSASQDPDTREPG